MGEPVDTAEEEAAVARQQQECEQEHRRIPIHESGHAVAHFMTAALMGFDPADTLHYVEIFRPGRGAGVGGGTCGARWSKDISDVACTENSGDDDAIAAAFAAGADSKSWLRAQLLMIVAGPVRKALCSIILRSLIP
jgi:hypothetical protein